MRVWLSVAVCLFISACATKPVKMETGLTQEDFWEEQANRRDTLVSVSGKATVRLNERGKSISGSAKIFFDTKDKIKMELRGPFGKMYFAAAKKGNSFTAYFPGEKLAFLDEQGGRKYLTQKLGVGLSYDEAVGFWLGKLPTSFVKFSSWKWDVRSESYLGTIETEFHRVDCYVDGDLSTLKKVVWKKPKPAFEVVFDDLGPCCGEKKSQPVTLAYSVKLAGLENRDKIELDWEDLERGAKLPQQIDIELPKETEKILLNH